MRNVHKDRMKIGGATHWKLNFRRFKRKRVLG